MEKFTVKIIFALPLCTVCLSASHCSVSTNNQTCKHNTANCLLFLHRLRVNCVGMFDVLTFDNSQTNHLALMPQYQVLNISFTPKQCYTQHIHHLTVHHHLSRCCYSTVFLMLIMFHNFYILVYYFYLIYFWFSCQCHTILQKSFLVNAISNKCFSFKTSKRRYFWSI